MPLPGKNNFEIGANQDRDQKMTLGSGPGAPMFEHGAQTRIRRAPVRAIATVTWDGGPREVYGQVLNVSPGGCLLKTETTIEPGTRLEMSIIVISEGERAKADVEAIVRRRTEDDGRQAYGVEFIALESTDKESVQWLYSQAMR
jgi:hypothetical protein